MSNKISRRSEPTPKATSLRLTKRHEHKDVSKTSSSLKGDQYKSKFQMEKSDTQRYHLSAGDKGFSAADATGNKKLPASLSSLLGKLPTKELASGEFQSKVAVQSGEGAFQTKHASGEGSYDALYAYAKGNGSVTLGADGLRASGELAAGAGLLEAEGHLKAGYGPVTAELTGKGFVGAKANVAGELTIDPAKGIYAAKVGGQAFIGAKAGVEGEVALGKYASVGGSAEAWAGLGVKANLDVGFKNNRFKFKADVGAALGIGFKLGVSFDVNLKPVTDLAKKGVSIAKDTFTAVAHPVKTFKRLLGSLF